MMDVLKNVKVILFTIDLAIHYGLLFGALWSVAFYQKRIWPPPGKNSWQYRLTWFGFYAAFILGGVLVIIDWDSWILKGPERFLLGIPLVIVGTLLVTWGIASLGVENTSGLKGGFKRSGPYRFTRNPQYLGDNLLFVGLVLVSNSRYLLVVNSLLILIFLIAPVVEEIWLEEQYGEDYMEYKKATPRFL